MERIPPVDDDELQELAYVKELCAEEIRSAEVHFNEKYPDGTPFLPAKEDYEYLDEWEAGCIEKVMAGKERYPEWQDYDVAGFVALVRMVAMFRFKRVERDVMRSKWNVQVETILSVGTEGETGGLSEPSPVPPPSETRSRAVRPLLRIVKNESPAAK